MKLSSPHMLAAMSAFAKSAVANGILDEDDAQRGIHRSLLAAQALRRREEEKDAKARAAAAELFSKAAFGENSTVLTEAEEEPEPAKVERAEFIEASPAMVSLTHASCTIP